MVKKIFITIGIGLFLIEGLCWADSGIRALSMGGAFVGLADDAEAVYWNPAGLGLIERTEVNYNVLLHNQKEICPDHSFNFVYPLPYIQNIRWGTIGFSFMTDVDKGIIDYDSVLSLDSELTKQEYVFSYGRNLLSENLTLGGNLRYKTYEADLNKTTLINNINYTQGTADSDSAFGFDLSGYFRWKKISFGLLFQNVNEPKINLYDTDIEHRLNVKSGITYHADNSTKYSIEISDFCRDNQIRIGGERWLAPYLAMRLGAYNLNKSENRAITFGWGLNSADIFAYNEIEIDYTLFYWVDNPSGCDDFSHFLGTKMKF